MPPKRALIVDDSRTAQFKLSRTLENYNLIIDTSLSAEDALGYLSYQLPDVIFMDHSMKGMNGLDAVKIIKSNSSTATIPVIMYTAQSGELYLSQARAMGAIDVLSKDVMTDLDIQRVMSNLKIGLKVEKAATQSPSKTRSPISKDQESNTNPSESSRWADRMQLRDQMTKSLEIQQSQFRRELQDNTKLLVTRFTREINSLRNELAQQRKLNQELHTQTQQVHQEPPKNAQRKIWLSAAFTLIGLLFLAMLLHKESSRNGLAMKSVNESLNQLVSEQQRAFKYHVSRQSRANLDLNSEQSKNVLSALVWAVNQQGEFHYNEKALDQDKLTVINEMLEHLSALNFSGTLTLNIHNGDFCVRISDDGQFSLPDQSIPATSCRFISNTVFNFDQASQTSIEFENQLRGSPMIESGQLNVVIKAHGLTKPVNRYPTISDGISSSKWNEVAQANNRVEIELSE